MVREHVAQLRPRRRDKKGMDHAKGRAMIHKFTLGHNTTNVTTPEKVLDK